MEHADGALERSGFILGSSCSLRHIGGEAAGREPAPLHLRQIHPSRAVQERIGAGGPGDVDVRVEGQQTAMQRDRVGGNGVVHDLRLAEIGVTRKRRHRTWIYVE